ncbi:hypothetical protein PR202_gb17296 [Eleusine coracana subsp. coracana]|uniref:RING-type E3 ubiquitin transferase n=1 Tax=Eleusine coracana subsp. coracana TaxID=191504 RepID=A0AAV5F2J0_ELECO|nr:hypothetical protein QOZ80_6BG0467880 [Eleusine coracana subsp. coracana]GJN29103.1 hypothetical protein PR202_gb17296 [Eleusine coracana subsp. coracana]
MSDLAFIIFLVVVQGVPAVILLGRVIWEIFDCIREDWQTAPAVIVDQGTALAALSALENRRVAPATQASRRPAEALPSFPYAQAQGRESETLCAICVEPLRQGQHCSEVPACRHAFHRDCLGVWARSKGTCPLCRGKIVPGASDGSTVADDMV